MINVVRAAAEVDAELARGPGVAVAVDFNYSSTLSHSFFTKPLGHFGAALETAGMSYRP